MIGFILIETCAGSVSHVLVTLSYQSLMFLPVQSWRYIGTSTRGVKSGHKLRRAEKDGIMACRPLEVLKPSLDRKLPEMS